MAANITVQAANLILDAEPALWIQFHTADPTDTGLVAVAAGLARVAVTLGAAAAGVKTSTANSTTAAVGSNMTLTHCSLWSAVTAGVCRWQGPLTAPVAVTTGQVVDVVAGDLSIALT